MMGNNTPIFYRMIPYLHDIVWSCQIGVEQTRLWNSSKQVVI